MTDDKLNNFILEYTKDNITPSYDEWTRMSMIQEATPLKQLGLIRREISEKCTIIAR